MEGKREFDLVIEEISDEINVMTEHLFQDLVAHQLAVALHQRAQHANIFML